MVQDVISCFGRSSFLWILLHMFELCIELQQDEWTH
ncbi:hypothetical protein KP509_37G057100 [Ceratopteris richardii]|uniref:Uncharacterized protein n=1 Tax=Ceratopteris richardii TaxID=49495 RepID=A0A8T2QAH4_CERRI|nr:hypothetical protein KP509_37G057100 [Ceratopteris richardii]